MENNKDSSGIGCGLSIIILGGILAAIGKTWGYALLVIGAISIVFSIYSSYQDKATKEKERKYKERHDQSTSRFFELQENAKRVNNPTINVTVTTDKDSAYEYSIKGINFCGVDDSMLGDFIGTARALKSNPHDPYAIGIYRGAKRVGFLPGGNQTLHAQITAFGGAVNVDGYIAKYNENGRVFYYGKVNLIGL